jgi:hypothetical protein
MLAPEKKNLIALKNIRIFWHIINFLWHEEYTKILYHTIINKIYSKRYISR